ncbi:hypothetical protein ACMAZE_12310 [Pseudopelagicola sp. nBUS_20]|uniref:hypothetical protein n=1 Tax=Pseudopelagicola sp. nBUS_20 TaxID=3395317 RepID=UPI003EBFF8D0
MKYVLLGIAAFALYVSNPSIQDFNFYIREQVSSRLQMDDDLANALASEFVTAAAIESTYRKDYIIASKFTIDTAGLRLFMPNIPMKVEVLGIGGQFIPLTDLP